MNRYRIFIESFLKKGYKPMFFNTDIPKKNSLLIRHDVDFDINLALEMSLTEDELNIKSSYFFLMASEFYNLLIPKNIEIIKSMINQGHYVSIHFDPLLYDDVEKGFSNEKALFESTFDVQIDFISIHRPSSSFIGSNELIGGVNHSYQPKYFNKIKYFADSGGSFRYGNPLNSEEFSKNEAMQLVIHPIWWGNNEIDPIKILSGFEAHKANQLKGYIANNCIPYKQYLADNE